ncbi:MAG: NYN domain-containing protein [Chloroflexi bacterium]|nr:NYN domain-containing protein [Chloroflexota bacterium]MCY3937856.1 NYN domain-containing protein [Chloroflexota bacterium]
MRVNVYVDGFNLYYGAVKGTPYKWLHLGKLCRLLRPKDRINRIRYFTADVKPRPNDPQADIRQQTYLRALKTIPNLMIHKGRFLSNETWMRLARPIESAGGETLTRALVIKTEEKGSDVNLASWLLIDGFGRDFQSALVISNDSDLVEPIRFVRQRLNRPCYVIHPHGTEVRTLRRAATTYLQLDADILAECQFAPTLTDSAGRTITKPTAW